MITIALVLIADQALKIWVKTNMYLDESIPIFGNWFYIHFIENPGMAFGFEFGGEIGKLILSLFRIILVILFFIYLKKQIREGASKGFIICIALVLAGALGNIIDSAFYGVLFSESPRFTPLTATFLPPEGGYAGFLHGHVVDMFYFPLIDGRFPEWFPIWGNEPFQFFRPVFNIADASITIGISIILLNQKRFFHSTEKEKENNDSEAKQEEEAVT